MLGRTHSSRENIILTQSSDFDKKLIFMFPRSPCGVSPRQTSKYGSSNSIQQKHGVLIQSLDFAQESLDFEKHFIFMFAGVETFENPLHFRNQAFPEDLAQGKSQNVGARISKNTSFPYPPWWKTLKIHIIFDSGFPRSYPKAYLKMLGVSPRHISKCWVELNSARKHNFDRELDFKINSFSCYPGWKMLKIHFIFGSELSLRVSPRHISKWWKTLKIHFIFIFELFLRTYPKAYLKMSSDFEKKLFSCSQVEIIANPLHFNLSFAVELAQAYLKTWVELNSARNHNFLQRARISKINSFSCYPGWKMLKIHIIFGFSFPEELAQGKSQNIG
ncbi:hypothetical protein E2320_000116 [Naja naja]|nr:hypothetical protein E2320_000116 [Naja naja]